MLVAKDQPTFEYLKGLFQNRQVQKEYLALVYGHPKQSRGTIDAPLGKLGTKQTTQIKGKKTLVERDAVTDYEVERIFKDYALVRAMPKTGRTHQIRVHLKHIGCPIAGDKLYASKKPLPPGLDRLFLHAWKLRLTGPDGRPLALEVDLPPSLQKVLDTLE
jgi:23S rRNA pseudouridine1911/1915/1917 synthase